MSERLMISDKTGEVLSAIGAKPEDGCIRILLEGDIGSEDIGFIAQ
jgi:hypothetical protein